MAVDHTIAREKMWAFRCTVDDKAEPESGIRNLTNIVIPCL
jgi:hypothetical protein